ncbi:MAG: TraB/GumN family protein, partial [Bacteroidetes bacterium]
MRKILFFLCLISFVTGPVLGQDQVYKPLPSENALLWKISGNGLQTPSYLYGTIHMIDKDDFFLTDSTRAAIEGAEKVVFEIDMADMNNIMTQLGLLKDAMMKDNLTLRDLISEEDYALVKKHFADMGLPLIFFERMKPMFLSMFAEMDFSQALGSGEMVSYEMEIMSLAEAGKKETGGLETAEYQMSLFDSIPYTDQAQMLVEAIKSHDPDGGEDDFDKMVELYKAQDVAGMADMMSGDDSIGSYEDILLHQRNRNWIPVMEKMMAEKPC